MNRYVTLAVVAILGGSLTLSCGGGGGAPPADVIGRIMLVGTGAPLSGATVKIGGASFTTDVSGAFVFRSVPSSSTQIMVTATGIKPLTQTLPTLTPNTAPNHPVNDLGDIFVVDSASGYTATASGFVIRADTLEVIPGARVVLSGQATVTDASGFFSFSNLPVGLGDHDVQVGLITKALFENKPITIFPPLGPSPPDNNLGQIAMSPPVGGIPGGPTNIRGTITLQGATDHSGTTATLIKRANGQMLGSVITGTDGRYAFWVIAGQYTVKAEHTGFVTQTRDVDLIRTDQPVTANMTLVP